MKKPANDPSKAAVESLPAGVVVDAKDGCCGCPPIADAALDEKVLVQAQGRGYGYLLDTFRPAPELPDNKRLPRLQLALAKYRARVAAEGGWTRVFIADAITGRPGEFLQLWRVPLPQLDPDRLAAVEKADFHRELVGELSGFDRKPLIPMAYDPGPGPVVTKAKDGGPPNVLLTNQITVKAGAMARLECIKKNFFVDAVSDEDYGWRLVAAAAVPDAAERTVFQLWELPDSDTLPYTMRRIGQNVTYRNCVVPCIEDENQQLFEVIDWSH